MIPFKKAKKGRTLKSKKDNSLSVFTNNKFEQMYVKISTDTNIPINFIFC